MMGAKLRVSTAADHLAWLEQHAGDGALSAVDTPPTPDSTAAQPAAAAPGTR
jgi:hypothetical protein